MNKKAPIDYIPIGNDEILAILRCVHKQTEQLHDFISVEMLETQKRVVAIENKLNNLLKKA